MLGVGAAIAALEQARGVFRRESGPGVDHLHGVGQQAHDDLALRACTCTALPIRLPSATATAASGASTTSPRSPSIRSMQRLAAELRAMGVEQLLGDAGDVGRAVAALVARQQQQGADQVGALLLGALDALQSRARLVVDVGPRQQQLDRAADHRQRRAQFVADVGVELAVALHDFGQARRRSRRAHAASWPTSSSAKCVASASGLRAAAGPAQAVAPVPTPGSSPATPPTSRPAATAR